MSVHGVYETCGHLNPSGHMLFYCCDATLRRFFYIIIFIITVVLVCCEATRLFPPIIYFVFVVIATARSRRHGTGVFRIEFRILRLLCF